jgi:hypothetical protein
MRETYTIDFSDDAERGMFLRELDKVRGLHKLEIKPSRLRTSAQNRLYFGVYIATWRRHLADQGDLKSANLLHRLLAIKFLMEPIYNEATGEIIGEEPRSTTELSPKEFSDYLEQIAAYLGQEFGITIPSAAGRQVEELPALPPGPDWVDSEHFEDDGGGPPEGIDE